MANPGDTEFDKRDNYGPGLEQAPSEPKQGHERPADWTPPSGNPGSDQDALDDRENGTAKTNDG